MREKEREKRNLLISKLHSASLIKVDPMMRLAERKLEKKRWKMEEELKDVTISRNIFCRYHAINITNSRTTEFRLGKGSLNPMRIAAVVEFADLQCDYARTHNWGQMSVEDFIEYLKIRATPNLKQFIARWM